MPDSITWYDVLGVSAGASAVTLRRAHDERVLLLRAYTTAAVALAEAPDPVADAAARAGAAVEAAWLALGDPERRKQYDVGLSQPPASRPRHRRTVPDLCGLFYRSSQGIAATAGLRLAVVRLTADPLPVEGLVVGQSLEPGAVVRRRSALTVQVWHPARAPLARLAADV